MKLLAVLTMIIFLSSCENINLGGSVQQEEVPFVTVWRVGEIGYGDGDLSLTFPTSNFEAYVYDYTIDWGDGSTLEYSQNADELTHNYDGPGDYTVKVTGKFSAMTTYLKGDKDKLIEVVNLGNVGWEKTWYAFYDADNLLSYEGAIPGSVTNMDSMFAQCEKLVTVNLSGSNTSNVTDMAGLFGKSPAIEHLDLSSFDTRKVTNMSNMFREITSLSSLDISNFNTSNVESVDFMFRGPNMLTSLSLFQFDTSKVTSMYGMFYALDTISNLDLSSFDTSNVESMRSMFNRTAFTSLNLGSFNTSKVTNFQGMFYNSTTLTDLDLSHFDTSSAEIFNSMFYGASDLENINLIGWDLSASTDESNALGANSGTLVVNCDQVSGSIFGKTCM